MKFNGPYRLYNGGVDDWYEKFFKTENIGMAVKILNEKGDHLLFKCPCGEGENVCLPINQPGFPSWGCEIDADGLITLSPSLLQLDGCKVHFFIKKGMVEWA